MSQINENLIWLLVVVAVFVGVLPLLMWSPWGGHMMGARGFMGYGWGFTIVIPILFLGLIALGVYLLITGFGRSGRRASSRDERPLQILNERYARGEITEEQYLKMKEELESWF